MIGFVVIAWVGLAPAIFRVLVHVTIVSLQCVYDKLPDPAADRQLVEVDVTTWVQTLGWWITFEQEVRGMWLN